MKQILYILLMLGGSGLFAQSIAPQVLNAAGSTRILGSTGVSVADNVGEAFTTLIANNSATITQGFLQPDVVVTPNFGLTLIKNDVSCSDKNDGSIKPIIDATVSGYVAQYIWMPPSACHLGNCTSLDSLTAGTYSLHVIISYTTIANVAKTDTLKKDTIIIHDQNGPCKVKVYTGVNISGSSETDHLYIQNIEEYPNNHITIYNRWGLQMYDQKGYDNKSKSWPSHDDQSKLLASTYFYVLDIGDGSKPIKGWIELIKN